MRSASRCVAAGTVQAWRPIPDELRQLWLVRNAGALVGAAALVVGLLLPAVASNSASITLVSIMAFSIIGLSVGIITGSGGQLSLGQFAVAAIGGTVSFAVSSRTGNFPLAVVYAGVAAYAVLFVFAAVVHHLVFGIGGAYPQRGQR